MKNFCLALIFFSFTTNSIAQINSNYARGFEIGFKEGYCYNRSTYDCFTPMAPLTPMPRLNENKENYTEGYNRGFQYGLDLKRSDDALRNNDASLNQKIISFNQYIPQNPTEAMRIVGMIKQKKYDVRTDWLRQKGLQLKNLNETLFNSQNFPEGFQTYTHKNVLRNILVEYFDQIKTYDFGDDYVFQNVQHEFNNIEKYYYQYYSSIVSQINERVQKESQISNRNSTNEITEHLVQKTNVNPENMVVAGIPESKTVNGKMYSSFLEKYFGNYNCLVNVYKFTKKGYVLEETMKGNIIIDGNVIKFKNDNLSWKARELLSEITQRQLEKYLYVTQDGDVYIDFDFKTITFYDLDEKHYYSYIIESKL